MDQKDFGFQNTPPENPSEQFRKDGALKFLPLSKPSLKLIPDVLKFLYIAYVNIPIYPAGSAMVSEPVSSLFDRLADIFTKDQQVVFSSVKDILIVNGERLKEGEIKKTFEDSFLKFFDDLRLDSICFKKGLSREELAKFLYILRDGIKEGQGLHSLFSKAGIEHIDLNEISYQAVGEGQGGTGGGGLHSADDLMVLDYIVSKVLMSGQGSNALENLERNSQEVADALSKISGDAGADKGPKDASQAEVILNLLQRLENQLIDQNPDNWQKCKSGLARTLLNLKPELRGRVIFGARNENEKNLVQNLMPELSDEEIAGIFLQAHQSREASLEQMHFAAKNLMGHQERKSGLASVLKQKFAETGLSAGEIEWIVAAKKFSELSIEDKAARISGATLDDYLLLRTEIEWNLLAKEISDGNRPDFFDAIWARYKEFFQSASAHQTAELSDDCAALMKSSLACQDIYTFKALEAGLPLLLEMNSAGVEAFLRGVVFVFHQLLDQNRVVLAAKSWDLLKKNLASASSPFSGQVIQMQQEIFSSEKLHKTIERYIQDSGKSAKFLDLVELIAVLGQPAVEVVVGAALADESVVKSFGYFDAFLRRRIFGKILAELINRGQSSFVMPLLDQNLKSPKEQNARNTVELLADIRNKETIPLLQYSLRHQDPKMRIKAIFALGKIGGIESVSLLNGEVKENIDEVRLDIISVLGRIGDSKSLAILKDLHDSENQEEIMKAVRLIEARLENPGHPKG